MVRMQKTFRQASLPKFIRKIITLPEYFFFAFSEAIWPYDDKNQKLFIFLKKLKEDF